MAAGLIPAINFGAIWDKYVNGNQAADILPGVNFNGALNPPAKTATPIKPGQVQDTAIANSGTGFTSGSSGGGGVSTGPNLANIRNNLNVSQAADAAAGHQSATDTGNKYRNDVLGFLGNIEGQQNTINSGQTNNALNLRRAMSSIANTIRTGLRSGGVSLANMNATDSGAADALARAYAETGNKQVGGATNEAAIAGQDLQQQQGLLDRQKNEGLQGFDAFKQAEISRIRGDVTSKLQALDATGQAQGVNGGVDMSIVDQVIQDAISQLAAVDQTKDTRLGGVAAFTPDQVNAKAAAMDQLGQGGASPFTTGQEGITLTGQDSLNGAPISQLPLISRKNGKDAALVAA